MSDSILVKPKDTYVAKRVPINHACKCGWSEMVVPPCGQGVIYWSCECGRKYRMEFKGKGLGAGHSIAKGI